MSELPSNEQEAIKADIEQARAELASTADALAAKLDVKAQARRKAQEAGARVSSTYRSARASVTEPAQRVWSKAQAGASPVLAKAAEDKRRTAAVAAAATAAVVAGLIVRRVTRRSAESHAGPPSRTPRRRSPADPRRRTLSRRATRRSAGRLTR